MSALLGNCLIVSTLVVHVCVFVSEECCLVEKDNEALLSIHIPFLHASFSLLA